MTKQLNIRRLIAVLIVLATVTAFACGGDKSAPEAAAPAASVPSLESAPAAPLQEPASPTLPSETATFTGVSDAPRGPKVTELPEPAVMPEGVSEELKIIWEAWEHLLNDYVDKSKLEPEAFSEEAIRGMLRALGDPEMSYIRPQVMAGSFDDVFRGNFEGIGAHVTMNRGGKLVIVAPIAGSPADLAGIRPGDIVLDVDGESLEGLSLLEGVAKIRGPKGTPVELLVKHISDIDPVLITVTRGLIPLTSVRLRSEPDAKFAHIRITDFYPNTVDHLRETILKAKDGGAKGLILDIRNNPGGTLDSVVDVASQFLEDGLVLYSLGGDGKRRDWEVRSGGVATDIPMVVLVNQFSASSSEVLVGALQDHQRAKVIGATTYGKGSVNILRRLSNGGGLYITIAHWYTPRGRLIEDEGLVPDIVVEDRDAREADVKQLKRAIEELELLTGESATG